MDHYGGGPFSDNDSASRRILTGNWVLAGLALYLGRNCAINARRTGRCVWLINTDFFCDIEPFERL